MRGAGEFEILPGIPGSAVAGMDAQFVSHLLTIVFTGLGNLACLIGGGRGGRV